MKRRGMSLALAVLGVAWLGTANQAEGGIACDVLVCPDSLWVCVNDETGESRIFDYTDACDYFGEGGIKENEKKGYLKVKAKATNESYGCEDSVKVKVKYDPETEECIKKAKIKVGDEKREIETPAPCGCYEG